MAEKSCRPAFLLFNLRLIFTPSEKAQELVDLLPDKRTTNKQIL